MEAQVPQAAHDTKPLIDRALIIEQFARPLEHMLASRRRIALDRHDGRPHGGEELPFPAQLLRHGLQRRHPFEPLFEMGDGFPVCRARIRTHPGLDPIAQRLTDSPGMRQMVGHEFGLILLHRRQHAADGCRDRAVELLAAPFQQALIGGIPQQRMLEGEGPSGCGDLFEDQP